MKAYQCDRCKGFFTVPTVPQKIIVKTLSKSLNKFEADVDICPDCQKTLDAWWNGEKKSLEA